MTPRAEAIAQLARYLARYPEEEARLAALSAQLADDAGDVFGRANMRGHITTSAIVLDASLSRVLLIHHKTLDRWLQPGGHYEAPGSLWDSALREVAEETGVTGLRPHPLCAGLPLDIDSHAIPGNPRKQEGAHWHHDYAYLALADGHDAAAPQALSAQLDEVHAAAWRPLAQLAGLPSDRLHTVAAKLAALLAS
ncbi:NUDIX hydrolase [Paucibacter soli]|uniref:NUDIX hydrolase n=1 Tax=Paucibacter soli TaxID=3133433 RepID=UPI0030A200A8